MNKRILLVAYISLLLPFFGQADVQFPQPPSPPPPESEIPTPEITLQTGRPNVEWVSGAFKPYVDFQTARERAEALVQQMTVDEKIELVGGYTYFGTVPIPRLGIPMITMSDATAGISQANWMQGNESSYLHNKVTQFPAPIMWASTFDERIAGLVGKAVAKEMKQVGIDVLLGPGMNMYRVAENGRNFEYFGEDPFLVSRLVENYVPAAQNQGLMTTLKHFVGNESDFYRKTHNSIIDERTLHEIYFPPFKAGIDAGALGVMMAYNLLNDHYTAESSEVFNYLLNDLNFKGFTVSDWWSVWNGKKAFEAGLNLNSCS